MNSLGLGISIIALTVLVGCEPSVQEIAHAKAVTDASATNPEVVTNLPDGRPVYRIQVGVAGNYDHFVYYIDNAQVTANYVQQAGKAAFNQPIVSLPVNPTPEQVIAEARRIEHSQHEYDAAEYKRLKAKFENLNEIEK